MRKWSLYAGPVTNKIECCKVIYWTTLPEAAKACHELLHCEFKKDANGSAYALSEGPCNIN